MSKQKKEIQKSKEDKNIKFGLTEKQRSRIYTALFILAFAIFFIVNNDWNGEEQGPYPPNYKAKTDPSSRTEAPNFELPDLEGSQVSLSDYKGKVIIIDFWATWCAPCRKAIPELIELKNEYADKGVEIIGISLDTDTKDNVDPFVEKMEINYPVVYGNTRITQSFGGIQSIPTSFVIDKQGRIFSRYTGYVNKQVYENDINKLIKEST